MSRRSVLRTTAGAAAAGAGGGLATATSGGSDQSDDGPGKYNVGYDAESGRAAASEAASEVVREFGFDALTVRLPEQAVSGLRNRPDVRYVEANGSMSTNAETLPWGVDRIDADLTHDVEDGDGVHVAILDTGIDGNHVDLHGNLGLGAWFDDGCSSCDYGWGDPYGHGTAVAGIVGAINNRTDVVGVAPGVTLHAVQVCDDEDSCENDEIAAGIEWVADQGYEVANMSLGGDFSSVIADAVEYAADRDVLMVASAGNDGPCTDCVSYPASDSKTLAVTAFAQDGTLLHDSNQGPETDFTAPTIVETTYPGGDLGFFGGTSAAAPHVAGAAAIARARTSSRFDAEALLHEKAENVGLPDNESGSGLPDVEAMVVEPWIWTDAVVLVEPDATLQGELKQLGANASSGEVYFEWGPSGDGLPNTTAKQSVSSPGTFSDTIGPLSCETYYEFRAVVTTSDGQTDQGSTRLFLSHACDDCSSDSICLENEESDAGSS